MTEPIPPIRRGPQPPPIAPIVPLRRLTRREREEREREDRGRQAAARDREDVEPGEDDGRPHVDVRA